jgi:hypothetical protein
MIGSVGVAGTNGTATPGGTGQLANPTTYSSIAINPFTSYPVTVPPGGYITISWYAQ